jgi:hypothetical protein
MNRNPMRKPLKRAPRPKGHWWYGGIKMKDHGQISTPLAPAVFGASSATTGPGFGGTLEAAPTPFRMVGD